jgi:transcriptional regulator with XRE-family HTH domain
MLEIDVLMMKFFSYYVSTMCSNIIASSDEEMRDKGIEHFAFLMKFMEDVRGNVMSSDQILEMCKKVAEWLEMNMATISKYEEGNVSPERRNKIAAAIGITTLAFPIYNEPPEGFKDPKSILIHGIRKKLIQVIHDEFSNHPATVDKVSTVEVVDNLETTE